MKVLSISLFLFYFLYFFKFVDLNIIFVNEVIQFQENLKNIDTNVLKTINDFFNYW